MQSSKIDPSEMIAEELVQAARRWAGFLEPGADVEEVDRVRTILLALATRLEMAMEWVEELEEELMECNHLKG